MGPGFHVFAQLAAERFLNSVPEGMLIAALAWSVLRLLRNGNSGTRFAVWFAALVAIVVGPFIPHWTAASSLPHVRPELTLSSSWAIALFSVWALIAAFALMRIGVALWNLRALRNSAVPIPADSLSGSAREVVHCGIATRKVVIATSAKVSVPTAIGFFKPAILLPEWAVKEMSEEELRSVVLHESAHLRRWDDWTNLFQRLARTVFCLHPAVWWIERHLSLEREMACDEAVMEQTQDPRAYAECLVSLAEKTFLHRGLAMAQALLGRTKETTLRLARILDGGVPKSSRVWKPAFAVAATLAVVCLAVMPNTPQLIAFESASPVPLRASASSQGMPMLPRGTAVVPAAYKIENNTSQRAVATHAPANAKSEQRAGRLTKPDSLHQPRVMRAALNKPAPSQHFFVVMQTAQYDDNVSIVRFTVWQVTLKSNRNQAEQTRVSKT